MEPEEVDLSVNLPRIPLPGETISGGPLSFRPGGKGANQAVVCARLGRDVSRFYCVGNDGFGKTLLNHLHLSKVDVSQVKKDDNVPTGTAMIFVDMHGENCIFYRRGESKCKDR